MQDVKIKMNNPVIPMDYPDPDVIRVGDTYYMLSTTMHFLPGAVILRSYDLANWEIASYVFETFEGTEEARMTYERSNYGCGMWAGSLRYHKGRFYVSFAAKQTCKTYFYCAEDIEGPWEKYCIDFYFHDGSLFFDEDDRIYLVFGHRDIWIRELLPDFSGLKPGGFARLLLTDEGDAWVPHEGAHFYRIHGKYYLFTIRWAKNGTGRRCEYCFYGDTLDGEFKQIKVMDAAFGDGNNGVAQGGLVETNQGEWYSVLFQDKGAVGRVPILVPVVWDGDIPVFGRNGEVPVQMELISNRPHYQYERLYTSDDFTSEKIKKQWQWNHEPNNELWEIKNGGGLKITTGKLSTNVTQAVNTLTQRMMYPHSSASVHVDASLLADGDYAGICALQGCYAMAAIMREMGRYYLVLLRQKPLTGKMTGQLGNGSAYMPGVVLEKQPLTDCQIELKLDANFEKEIDQVTFFYREAAGVGAWKKLGEACPVYFALDHFTGCRYGLSVFSTKKTGGSAVFHDFNYRL